MGLDNIPVNYPCIAEGMQDINNELDCQKNIAEHKCPWDREMQKAGTPIYGMLGTPCWFRGKAGQYMLGYLENHGYYPPNDLSFYGTGDEGDELVSPEACLELAEWMADHSEAYAKILSVNDYDIEKEMEGYRYAINWLKFVSEYG